MTICRDKTLFFSNSGASLIATVLLLLIFSLLIAVAVSIITTGSNISLQEEQGTQALFIADGGLQFGAMFNFPNHDGLTPVSNEPLGAGSFSLAVPTLSANINGTVTDINISSTDGFQTAPDGNYWIMLCDDFAGGNARPNATASTHYCEKISFTGFTATSFTGGTRGRDSSSAVSHLANAVVIMYTWDAATQKTLARNLQPSDNCTTPNRTICLNNTTGLSSLGFIRITDSTPTDIEDVFYNGIGTTVAECGGTCTACLGINGCTRKAFNGNGNGYDHNNPATDLVYQSEISALTTSTGTITNILSGNVMRRVQGALAPLQ